MKTAKTRPDILAWGLHYVFAPCWASDRVRGPYFWRNGCGDRQCRINEANPGMVSSIPGNGTHRRIDDALSQIFPRKVTSSASAKLK